MPKKVLIIDDDMAIMAALVVRLRSQGYEVVSGCDGFSGLKVAEREKPDVILLDIRLPDIDGFGVIRALRASADLARVPVIFLSADAQEETRQQGMVAGAKFFLAKPWDPQRLLAAVEVSISDRCGTEERRSPKSDGDSFGC